MPSARHSDASPVRINKALADAGLCSRRKAEDFVTQGRVRVNGELVTSLAHKVYPDRDHITVNDIPLKINAPRTYVLLHKPVQVVCTVSDPEGRTTILDILPEQWRAVRLYPVGRLDYFSEGLLLLTDDGDLAQRLAHPRFHLQKIYEVTVRGAATESALTTMRRGMTLAEGEKLAPVGVKVLPHSPRFPQDTALQMTLRQGLNRQIRRMCRDVGLTILRLRRVAQGPLTLGDLPVGAARSLTESELEALRKAAGLA